MNRRALFLPESVFIDHFKKSNLHTTIDKLFLSNKFKLALTQDIYAVVYSNWKKFMEDEANDDVPEYIRIFDADKIISKTLNDLYNDIYPNKETDLFEQLYNNAICDDDSQDTGDADFCSLLVILILNSGFVKKVLKRSYKTMPMEVKGDLVRLASMKFLEVCSDVAKKFHPEFTGLRPLNALEAKSILYDDEFISSFKLKKRKR